jgi:adenylate kinase
MIGAPGVGKGTYSRMLSKDIRVPELSSGDELRKIIKNKSPLNTNIKRINLDLIKKTLESGLFMDDQFMFEFMKEKLSQPEFSKGVILDGYPRNVNQAKSLDSLMDLNLVIKIELREDILIRKLCGRRVCAGCGKNYNICAIHEGDYDMEPLLPKKDIHKCDDCSSNLISREDDVESTIKNRLEIYKIQTSPIEEFYAKRKILKSFEPKRGIKDYPLLLKLVKNSVQLE